MAKYKPKPRKPMDIVPEETGCKSWTEVYESIVRDKKWFLKEDTIYFNARFYNSGSVTLYEMPVERLESYCWRELHGEKAPKKEVVQTVIDFDSAPF